MFMYMKKIEHDPIQEALKTTRPKGMRATMPNLKIGERVGHIIKISPDSDSAGYTVHIPVNDEQQLPYEKMIYVDGNGQIIGGYEVKSAEAIELLTAIRGQMGVLIRHG